MAISAQEAREQILDELGAAVDQLAVAVACLGEAFELLTVAPADRLEADLFRPVQRAYATGKRTHSAFAAYSGVAGRAFELPSPGLSSQGPKAFVERAVEATGIADHLLGELQDSMLPIESGDPALRSGLSEVRELLAGVRINAREFLRTLGR